MDFNNNNKINPTGFLGALTFIKVLFLTNYILKILDYIDWSWWIIFWPVYMLIIYYLACIYKVKAMKSKN